jgi:hypothetical protein
MKNVQFFYILCSFVTAQRIQYLEYELVTLALTVSHSIVYLTDVL